MKHHIKQPDIDKQTNPSLYWTTVEREIRSIPDINQGDQVNFLNGQLVGFVVKNLSDFECTFTEEACVEILKEATAELLVLKRPIRADNSYSRLHAYSVRRVIDSDGNWSEQVLISALSSPAWVNIGRDEVVVKAH